MRRGREGGGEGGRKEEREGGGGQQDISLLRLPSVSQAGEGEGGLRRRGREEEREGGRRRGRRRGREEKGNRGLTALMFNFLAASPAKKKIIL